LGTEWNKYFLKWFILFPEKKLIPLRNCSENRSLTKLRKAVAFIVFFEIPEKLELLHTVTEKTLHFHGN